MTDEKNTGQGAPTPLIEGPSATNSPDNANSGPAAYVIFGVAVALVVLLATSVTGCVAGVAQLAVSDFGYYSDSLGEKDIHDMLDELLGDSVSSDYSVSGTTSFDS